MQNNRIDEDLDYNIYKYSYEYLLSILPEGLHSIDLKKYFNENNKLMATTIDDTFKQIIFSSQNTGILSNIINFNQRENVIKTILYDYKIDKIAELSTDKLFQEFVKVFNIKVKSKNLKQNSWYKWSNTIIDAANFLMQFENFYQFDNFVRTFECNIETQIALPLLISAEISGMQFTLACDFLKEVGYTNYIKPDVHMIDIANKLKLCEKVSPIDVFKTFVRIAKNNKISPYKLDKILWLICSGKFYNDFDKNGKTINNKSHKEPFINFMLHKI